MAGIVLREVSKVYDGGVRAVDALDLTIEDGEFFALLGPSGSGKTTLLRTIAGLEAATSGRMEIAGRDVTDLPPGKRDVAMVFQDYALFPHMAVADNIAYPLRIRKVPRDERRSTAERTGSGLSLDGLMERRPAQLSGGQQQRVAVARAIVARPQLFLFDEPLSNLDARLRLEARTFLKRLQRDLGVTTVYVTHDQSEALALADRMAVMDHGRICQLGTPKEVFQRPANTFFANFIGSTPMNLLDGVVERDMLRVAGSSVPLPEEARGVLGDGEQVFFGVRPEYLSWSSGEPPGAGIRGRVVIVENLGTEWLVSLEAGDATVQLTVSDGEEPDVGAEGWAVVPPGRGLVYDAGDGELVARPVPAAREA